MQEYIRTLIYVSVFSIILEVILPETNLKKYISTMIALLIVFVTISPIINLFKSEDLLETITNTYENMEFNVDINNNFLNEEMSMYSNKQIKYNVKRKIELDILNRYNEKGVMVNKVEVVLNDEYLIETVNIYASDVNTVDEAKELMNDLIEEYKLEKKCINIIKGE